MSEIILITGASSGLGLAFLQHYATQPSTALIIAIDMHPLPSPTSVLPNIAFHQADISNDSQIHTIASEFSTQLITLVLHCAGIRGLNTAVLEAQRAKNEPGNVAAAEDYQVMNKSTLLRTFEINTIGTFNTISAFLPSLLLAPTPPKVIILSSRMGSVASNVSGGGYAYRASKAALNAVVKSFSIDVPSVMFLLLHPGRVETGLVGWKEEGAISVEESVRDCLGIIEGLGKDGSGKLVDRFGMEIPW